MAQVVLVSSILCQAAAVALAVRLMPKFTRRWPLLFLVLAVALMLLRRLGNLWAFLRSEDAFQFDLLNESIALATSLLLILGLAYLTPQIGKISSQRQALIRTQRALHTLSQTNQALIYSGSERELLERVCRVIVEIAGYRLAWFGYARDDERKSISIEASFGFEAGYLENLDLTWSDVESGQGPSGEAIRSGKASVAQFIAADPRYELWREEALKRGYGSSMAIPVLIEGGQHGLLHIYAREEDAFDDQVLTLMDEVASDLAFGLRMLRVRDEREKAEQEIHRLKVFNEEIVKNSIAGIVVQDEAFRFDYINPAAEELLGYQAKDLIGLSWRLVVPEDQHEIVQAADSRRFAGQSDQYELVLRRKDGTLVNVLVSGRPRVIDGVVSGAYVVFTNITQQIQATKRLASVLHAIKEGIIALDRDRRIILKNPAGTAFLSLLTGSGEIEILDQIGDLSIGPLATEKPISYHSEFVLKGPPERCFDISLMDGRDHLPDVQNILVIREVTELRQLQRRAEQRERLSAVGQLAAGIAHDFNNILSSILLYSGLLLEDAALAEKSRHQASMIEEQTKRASQLVEQILDFSRRSVMRLESIELGSFLEKFLMLLAPSLTVDIRVRLEKQSADYCVNIDPRRLEQVLINLAFNARDAMQGGGELVFELTRAEILDGGQLHDSDLGPGRWIVIRISDNGMGMDPEILPHIFEPFFTTKEPGKGTGLGLAQVYGILTSHGGSIDVKSQSGMGTTFTIYLPEYIPTDTKPGGRLI